MMWSDGVTASHCDPIPFDRQTECSAPSVVNSTLRRWLDSSRANWLEIS